MIAVLSDELLRYDIEIASLQEKLDRLRIGRAELQTHDDDCRSILAPIRRLPPEILVEILGLCWDLPVLPVVGKDISWELKQLANAPLLILSQVCVWWHGIVMGTAVFWGTIRVADTLWADPIHSDTAMTLLRSALDRGANCSLAVHVENGSRASSLSPPLQLLA
ncbi:hypothetical protein C8R44DRAFT_790550 [Mycena epipterygia]|nr:hypothetical protein C8R44DRAFT_790550 [Mycena epipterygia]